DLVGDAVTRIDVRDLADGEDLPSRLFHAIEQRRLRRGNGEVAAVAGALESVPGFAGKGTRDDAADLHGLGEFEGDLADAVEPLEAEMGLVGGDLEHRIDRGV